MCFRQHGQGQEFKDQLVVKCDSKGEVNHLFMNKEVGASKRKNLTCAIKSGRISKKAIESTRYSHLDQTSRFVPFVSRKETKFSSTSTAPNFWSSSFVLREVLERHDQKCLPQPETGRAEWIYRRKPETCVWRSKATNKFGSFRTRRVVKPKNTFNALTLYECIANVASVPR